MLINRTFSPVVITSRGNGKAIISAGSGYGMILEMTGPRCAVTENI